MENIILNITNSTNKIKNFILNLENNSTINFKKNIEIYFDSLLKINDMIEKKEIIPTQILLNTILTNTEYFFSHKIHRFSWNIYQNFKNLHNLFSNMIINHNLQFNEDLFMLYHNLLPNYEFNVIMKDYIQNNKLFTENETLVTIKYIDLCIYDKNEKSQISNKLTKLFYISDSTIIYALKHNYMKPFITYLKNKKQFKFNNEHINVTIEHEAHELYLFLVENDDIILTQHNLENACLFSGMQHIAYYEENMNICAPIICDLLNRKFTPTSKCLQNLLLNINVNYNNSIFKIYDVSIKTYTNMVNLLIIMGLKVTQEDFELLTKKMIELNNIQKYNVQINDKIIKICNEIGFYPYSIKPTIEGLSYAVKNNVQLINIKKMISTYEIVPNIECLREACKKENLDLIKYLSKDFNLKPDLICLKNSIMIYHDERKNNKRAMYFLNLIANIEENKINKIILPKKNIIEEDIINNFNKIISIKQLKELVKKHNFIPDIDCLKKLSEFTLGRTNNVEKYIELVDFMIEEYKINIDYECFENSIKALGNKQILFLFEQSIKS